MTASMPPPSSLQCCPPGGVVIKLGPYNIAQDSLFFVEAFLPLYRLPQSKIISQDALARKSHCLAHETFMAR